MSIVSICRNIRKVTDEELAELGVEAARQLSYMHPLKMGTAAKQCALGQYNMGVIQKLRELRDFINAGP